MGFTFIPPTVVGGTVLVIERVQSPNFVSGSAGWVIAADGSAEFYNLVARGTISTGSASQSHWVIGSSPVNDIQGVPAVNPNNPVPGILRIDSTLVQVTPARYMYEVILRPPYSALNPTASSINPWLHLSANENLGTTGAELRSDVGSVGGPAPTDPYIGWDVTAPYIFSSKTLQVLQSSGAFEAWHIVGNPGQPAFQGNWAVQGASTVGFTKDVAGRVQLRGQAAEPVASSSVIFTLPVGYRPSQNMSWAIKCNNDSNSVAWVRVTTDGLVTPIGNTAFAKVQTVLDGITFSTLP